MANTVIRVTSNPTFRAINGRWARATVSMLNEYRDGMRIEGRRLVDLMRNEAPEGKTGKFKKNIRFRTFASSGGVGFTVSTPQPLGKWIIKGTPPHRIAPKGRGYPLKFYWKNGQLKIRWRTTCSTCTPNESSPK